MQKWPLGFSNEQLSAGWLPTITLEHAEVCSRQSRWPIVQKGCCNAWGPVGRTQSWVRPLWQHRIGGRKRTMGQWLYVADKNQTSLKTDSVGASHVRSESALTECYKCSDAVDFKGQPCNVLQKRMAGWTVCLGLSNAFIFAVLAEDSALFFA